MVTRLPAADDGDMRSPQPVVPLEYAPPAGRRNGHHDVWLGLIICGAFAFGVGFFTFGVLMSNGWRDDYAAPAAAGLAFIMLALARRDPLLASPHPVADVMAVRTTTLMRIIGLDPGLQITGYGVIDWKPVRPALVDGGVIRLKAKTPLADRLVELEAELDSLFDEHKPDRCAVEQLYSNYEHPRHGDLDGTRAAG